MFGKEPSGSEGTKQKEECWTGERTTGGQGAPNAQESTGSQEDNRAAIGESRVTRRAPKSLDCAEQSGAGVVEWAGCATALQCWIRRGAVAYKVVCLVVFL